MARHKDLNWSLPEGVPNSSGGRTHEPINVHSALLMDIRDELRAMNREMRALNATIQCPNFIRIPRKLEAIRAAIAKQNQLTVQCTDALANQITKRRTRRSASLPTNTAAD